MNDTPPDTIVGTTAFWIETMPWDFAIVPNPKDGDTIPPGYAALRVDFVDDHMFGGRTRGTRYLIDRREVPDWAMFSLPRLPLEVRVTEMERKIPLHYRALYARDGEASYAMRGPYVSCWSK